MGRTGHSAERSSRRALLRTAGWSVPAVSAALAAPALAVSSGGGRPNSEANYSWSAESQGTYTRLEPDADGLGVTYSTQVSYQATPYVSPPAQGVLVLQLDFSGLVRLDGLPGGWTLRSPSGLGPASRWQFAAAPSGQGGSLSLNLTGTAAGPLSVTTTMTLENGGSTTWSTTENSDATVLVAG